MDDLMREFLTESAEGLSKLDLEIIQLEQNPHNPALLGSIFRVVHTIKGTCGFVGLPRLEKLAHAAENVFGKFRDGELPVTPAAISLILRSLDTIKILLAHLEHNGTESPGEDKELIAELNAAAEGKTALPMAAKKMDEAIPSAPSVADQSVRIDVGVLENLMTTVNELVLNRNQLLQILRKQKDSSFTAPLQRLNQVTSELQEGVMKTRMQPIGNAWAKLPRIVRDVAQELGKKIDLRMMGAETELDRQVLELIKDPLTHMVRNSADHGIETPAERLKAGKPETGSIILNAYHEGGHIVIEVSDDGKGLALDKIKAKAREKGFATEAELAAFSEQQILQFIFKPGFSTAANVTAVSGRGVGMDVVKTNIDKIGGTIDFKSVQGKGSCFFIKIPLTLAIVSALIVECAGERFALPQINVVELVRVAADGEYHIEYIDNAPVLRLRNRLLPLVSLRKTLKLGEAEEGEAFVVVAQTGRATFGIMVDRVFDAEEIVVKPVSRILRDINIFFGNTILGDGGVIMILDVNGIAASAGAMRTGEAAYQRANLTPVHRERQALLLFRAGEGGPKAVPLPFVARLESINSADIEYSNGTPVMQYHGKLMPLISIGSMTPVEKKGAQPILVFAEGERRIGLMADEIIDIVDDNIRIDLSVKRAGYIGSAIVAGKATDIIDAAHYLELRQ